MPTVTSENREEFNKKELEKKHLPKQKEEDDEKEMARRHFEKNVKEYLTEGGFKENILPNGMVRVYHGTSEKNLKGILKDKKFKGYPFFSPHKETAHKFSKQAGGKSTVHEMEIHPSALVTVGGYLTARTEGLKQHPQGHWDY